MSGYEIDHWSDYAEELNGEIASLEANIEELRNEIERLAGQINPLQDELSLAQEARDRFLLVAKHWQACWDVLKTSCLENAASALANDEQEKNSYFIQFVMIMSKVEESVTSKEKSLEHDAIAADLNVMKAVAERSGE